MRYVVPLLGNGRQIGIYAREQGEHAPLEAVSEQRLLRTVTG
jgi:hypothetical protein